MEHGEAWLGDLRVAWSCPSGAPLGDLVHLTHEDGARSDTLSWSVRAIDPRPAEHVHAYFGDVRVQASPLRIVTTTLSLDVHARSVDARWQRSAGSSAAEALAASIALRFAVAPHGWAHLHAGAVELDDGSSVVIAGGSGSGKSTTTLALVASGLAAMSDDGTFVRSDGVAIGVARPAHVAPRTRAAFAHLGRVGASVERGKLELALHREMQRGPRHVRAVVLPRVQPELPSAIERLDATGAFAALLGCCTPALIPGLGQETAIDVVERLVTGRLLALRLGADSLDRPAIVRELIERGVA